MDKELIVILGSVLVITLLTTFLVGGGIILFEKTIKCPSFGSAVELESKYIIWGGGCFVKTEQGQWVKDENYWNSPLQDKK